MDYADLFAVQKGVNKLKSLYRELEELEQINPYKSNIASDMPKSRGNGKNFTEWYAEEHERIENEIEFCKQSIQKDRKIMNAYLDDTPFPESEIIRYRAVNGLSWEEIGNLLNMDRRTVSRKFFRYINLPTMPT